MPSASEYDLVTSSQERRIKPPQIVLVTKEIRRVYETNDFAIGTRKNPRRWNSIEQRIEIDTEYCTTTIAYKFSQVSKAPERKLATTIQVPHRDIRINMAYERIGGI
jgi:hypothetical protein